MRRNRQFSLVLIAGALTFLALLELFARCFLSTSFKADAFYADEPRNARNFDIVRAIENVPSKKSGLRVVVTGGSVAYGWGASDDAHRFPAILQSELQRRWNVPVEVVNAGVPDFTASDELILYTEKLRALNADMVVMFTGFNDLWDSLKYMLLDKPAPRLAQTFQHRVIAPAQTGPLFLAFLRSLGVRLEQAVLIHSAFYRWVKSQLTRISYKPVGNLAKVKEEAACESLGGFYDAVFAMGALARRHEQNIVVVIQPMRFLAGVPLEQFPISRYEQILRRVYEHCVRPTLLAQALKSHTLLFDTNPVLAEKLVSKKAYIDFCHVNDEGNALIASYVARQITSRTRVKDGKLFLN